LPTALKFAFIWLELIVVPDVNSLGTDTLTTGNETNGNVGPPGYKGVSAMGSITNLPIAYGMVINTTNTRVSITTLNENLVLLKFFIISSLFIS
jgi:hypothetical protein